MTYQKTCLQNVLLFRQIKKYYINHMKKISKQHIKWLQFSKEKMSKMHSFFINKFLSHTHFLQTIRCVHAHYIHSLAQKAQTWLKYTHICTQEQTTEGTCHILKHIHYTLTKKLRGLEPWQWCYGNKIEVGDAVIVI